MRGACMRRAYITWEPIATASIGSGTTLTMVRATVTSTFGARARIVVKGARGASGVCVADFAADLLLKE